jgi:UDP-glucose 4-epimerase
VRILVTGGSGFVGRAVVRELRRLDHEVTVLTRRPGGDPGWNDVTVLRGDLTSPATISSLASGHVFGGICHLAGLTSIRDSLAQATAYFDVNVGGTVGLLKAVRAWHARTGRPTRMVFASSRAVYAGTAEGAIPEIHPAIPATPYGLTKRVVEQLLGFECDSPALGATTLRCFNVAGGVPGNVDRDTRRLIPWLVGVMARRQPELRSIASGSRRDFVHVTDAGRAFAAALQRTEPGAARIYNLGSGTGTSFGEIIALLEHAAGRHLPRAAEFTDEPADSDGAVADISLIGRELGWFPMLAIDSIVNDAWQFAEAES